MGGATSNEKGLWLPSIGINTPIFAQVTDVTWQPWSRKLYDDRQEHELEPHARCKASGVTRPFQTPYGVEFVELAELQRLFIIEAGKYSALPLDDRTFERFNADLAGRPQLIKGKSQILFGGMGRLSENSIVSIKNKSYSITADVDVPKSGAEGVIVAQGGSLNGWSLYAKGGKLKYCYNFFGIELTFVEATKAIPAGHHQVRMEFKYDGGGLAGLRSVRQRIQRRSELGADRP